MKPLFTIREGSAANWAIRVVTAVVVVLAVVWVPTRGSAGFISTTSLALTLMAAAMALNLVLGYAGQISIGHSAFFGLGAYTTGICVSRWGFSPWVTFPIAFAISYLLGVIVSFPASRIKGVYLALVTLALALLFPKVLTWGKLAWLTGGGKGLPMKGAQVPSTGFNIGRKKGQMPSFEVFGHDWFGDLRRPDNKGAFWYWIAIAVVIVVYLACRGVVKSRAGRALIAIRDNETAAAVMGVNLVSTKAFVFGLSAGLCALPGCVVAIQTEHISPEGIANLTIKGAITFLIVMVVGGAGSLWGPVVGSLLYVYVTDTTKDWATDSAIPGVLRPLLSWAKVPPADGVFALLLIVLMFAAPRGVIGAWRQYSPRIVRVLPRPAGTQGATFTAAPAAVGDSTTQGEPE